MTLVTAFSADWLRIELDYRAGAERASRPEQQPLPFGDGFLDDQGRFVLAHGTTVGLGRHAAGGEDLCSACQVFMDELIAAGFARRLDAPGRSP